MLLKVSCHETFRPISFCHIAALSGSDAIRVFPVGEVLGDAGVWRDGVPILSGAEGVAGLYLWYFGTAVPAVL